MRCRLVSLELFAKNYRYPGKAFTILSMQASMIPAANQEAMQILHYQNGQKYEPHHDFFHDKINQAPNRGGQRIATILMYLTTPEEGGETVFPNAQEKVYGDDWSDCAKKGLSVKARRGNALLFFSLHPDGREDPSSLHGSCPTTKGDKWSATKWIRVGGCAQHKRHTSNTDCTLTTHRASHAITPPTEFGLRVSAQDSA